METNHILNQVFGWHHTSELPDACDCFGLIPTVARIPSLGRPVEGQSHRRALRMVA
jgi:hypothetical protein